jgi:hypothetical protein
MCVCAHNFRHKPYIKNYGFRDNTPVSSLKVNQMCWRNISPPQYSGLRRAEQIKQYEAGNFLQNDSWFEQNTRRYTLQNRTLPDDRFENLLYNIRCFSYVRKGGPTTWSVVYTLMLCILYKELISRSRNFNSYEEWCLLGCYTAWLL